MNTAMEDSWDPQSCLYREVIGKVFHYALQQVRVRQIHDDLLLGGIPCIHIIKRYVEREKPLGLHESHSAWCLHEDEDMTLKHLVDDRECILSADYRGL